MGCSLYTGKPMATSGLEWQMAELNHRILCQLTRSTKLIHGHGAEVLFVATSDRLPSYPAKKVGEPQTGVSPLLGLISVAYWWIMVDDWLFQYPPQVKHLWFQQKVGIISMQWFLPFVTYTQHWATLNKSHPCLLVHTVTLWLITSVCFCWNHKCL